MGPQVRAGTLTPPTLEMRKQKEVALVWALLASTTIRPWSSVSARYRPVVTCRIRSGWPQRRWLPLQLQEGRVRGSEEPLVLPRTPQSWSKRHQASSLLPGGPKPSLGPSDLSQDPLASFGNPDPLSDPHNFLGAPRCSQLPQTHHFLSLYSPHFSWGPPISLQEHPPSPRSFSSRTLGP